MTDNNAKIRAELEGLGLPTFEFESPQGTTVAFDYRIPHGPREGEQIKVGVSNPDGDYPEYPPHWVHVSPPIDDGRGGSTQVYTHGDQQWLAMSRPPADFWDLLPTKHMSAFIDLHLARIWKDA